MSTTAAVTKKNDVVVADDTNAMKIDDNVTDDGGDTSNSTFLEKLQEESVRQLIVDFLNSDIDPVVRCDVLEIGLRKAILQQHNNLEKLNTLWTDALHSIHEIVLQAEKLPKVDSSNNTDDAIKKEVVDDDKNDGNVQNKMDVEVVAVESNNDNNKSSTFSNIKGVCNHLRKLPMILLEDIFDILAIDEAYEFWKLIIINKNSDVLFGVCLWHPSPKQHPCWLLFLKTANKLLRRLQQQQQETDNENYFAIAAADVLKTLSTVYPMNEKSTTRVWGSHNTDNVVNVETENEFNNSSSIIADTTGTQLNEHNIKTVATTGTTTPATTLLDYDLYETFWKLQHDFRNPNGVVVADFLHRLKTVLRSLDSHPCPDQNNNTSSINNDSATITQIRPYLTHSHLLPIQLRDQELRTILLTQFWIISHHLTSQVSPLRAQLQVYVDMAEKLLSPKQLELLQKSHIFLQSEAQWRQWKQKKCQPDIEPESKKSIATETRKRKRQQIEKIDKDENIADATDIINVPDVSKKMCASIPEKKQYMEDYVEALDPDSGIEAEYHPKNDTLFTWRALRLLSTDHLQQFEQIQPNGDFENMVRDIYKNEYDEDIPGEGPQPYIEDEDDEEEKEEEEDDEVDQKSEEEDDEEEQQSGQQADVIDSKDGSGSPESDGAEIHSQPKDEGEKTDSNTMNVDKSIDENAATENGQDKIMMDVPSNKNNNINDNIPATTDMNGGGNVDHRPKSPRSSDDHRRGGGGSGGGGQNSRSPSRQYQQEPSSSRHGGGRYNDSRDSNTRSSHHHHQSNNDDRYDSSNRRHDNRNDNRRRGDWRNSGDRDRSRGGGGRRTLDRSRR